MRLAKRILFGLALAASLAAQTTPPAAPAPAPSTQPPHLRRVFLLKYADARHVASLLNVFGYSINADLALHVIAVTAPADGIAAVEDAIKRLDVPAAAPKDVDLVISMIVASEQSSAGGELPAELQPVATELKKLFPFKSIRLLDTILLRTQPGNRAQANGVVVLPNYTNGGERPYGFSVYPNSVTEDGNGHLIRLEQLHLSLQMPGGHEAGIQTEITVREGQRVVVGKSNMGNDQALVLVVTAKVTE